MRRVVHSLRARLVLGSIIGIGVALAFTGLALVILFRTHIERRFDASLKDHLEEIAAAAEVGSDDGLKLTWEPADPRFKPPLSGWYWEIRGGQQTLRRSASLEGASLPVAAPGPGAHVIRDISWPVGEHLRVIVQDIRFPEKDTPLTVIVAGPRREIRAEVRSFASLLAVSLGVLAAILASFVLAQVSYGLRPLGLVRDTIGEIRRGSLARIPGDAAPSEVTPLINELNALLSEREAKLARARAEAGDLAHALKTPIAIIANEAARAGGETGDIIGSEARRMQRVVEHHLVRARSAALHGDRAMRAPVAPVVEDVRFSIGKLHPELAVAVSVPAGVTFAGDPDDLGEMLGNLADNAAKWARSRIVVAVEQHLDRLSLVVDDDGPGMTPEECAASLERGERLDRRGGASAGHRRGHGLGLAIVSELVDLYRGRLQLERSALGGLRAKLELPAWGRGMELGVDEP